MSAVHVEEPKESAFSRCPWQRMMHTEDGVTSGSERLRKPGKWTRILEDRSMMTIYTCKKHFDPEDIEICNYHFMNSSTNYAVIDSTFPFHKVGNFLHIKHAKDGDSCLNYYCQISFLDNSAYRKKTIYRTPPETITLLTKQFPR